VHGVVVNRIVLLVCVVLVPLFAAEEPEYYCYDKKRDMYAMAYPGDKDECEEDGEGKFGTFSRKKFGWLCRYSDSVFMIGKKTKKAKAMEYCASGKLEKLK